MKELEEMKPSALIRMALDDLERAEVHADYLVEMDDWHTPGTDQEYCRVCLAGAVIAFSLKGQRDLMIGPDDFTRGTRTAGYLYALDHFRIGNLRLGLMMMEIDPKLLVEPWQQIVVVPYEQNETHFKEDMRAIISRLERTGL